jgi:hypothetical protein
MEELAVFILVVIGLIDKVEVKPIFFLMRLLAEAVCYSGFGQLG